MTRRRMGELPIEPLRNYLQSFVDHYGATRTAYRFEINPRRLHAFLHEQHTIRITTVDALLVHRPVQITDIYSAAQLRASRTTSWHLCPVCRKRIPRSQKTCSVACRKIRDRRGIITLPAAKRGRPPRPAAPPPPRPARLPDRITDAERERRRIHMNTVVRPRNPRAKRKPAAV